MGFDALRAALADRLRRADPRSLGKSAEDLARAHLEAKGFRFLRANHRTRFGEVDLVMKDGDTLVFVEVRARGREDYGRAAETVTPAKQRKVVMAALDYVKSEGRAKDALRFDVVAVGPAGVEHLPNAFGAGGGYTL